MASDPEIARAARAWRQAYQALGDEIETLRQLYQRDPGAFRGIPRLDAYVQAEQALIDLIDNQ